MSVSLTIIFHTSPLCHSFTATLQLGLLHCHNSTRQELITRWDSERELLRSAPGSYPNHWNNAK